VRTDHPEPTEPPAPASLRTWRGPLALLGLGFVAALLREPVAPLGLLLGAAIAAALAALTLRLTRPLPPPAPRCGRADLQLACAAAFYVYGLLDAARVFGLVALPAFAPLEAFEALVARHGVKPRWVVNPLLGGVLPAVAMLLLGADRRELGLSLGWRSGRTALLWCALPLALVAHSLVVGAISFAWLGRSSLDAALQAAIGEELFDRGVLQTRLERFGPAWAVVGGAILFGLGHVPVHLDGGAPDLLTAAARCMLQQTAMGLVFALLFWRTRSLVPSMLLHTLVNVLAGMPG
jgi:membrane protease YdiL (CAAX protease family)